MTFLLALVVALSVTGAGQVGLQAELGWEGQAVAGEVNPLWVRVTHDGPGSVRGVLVVHQRTEPGWYGESERWMRRPVELAPRTSTEWILPWPLALGASELSVTLEVEGQEQARASLPVVLASLPVQLHLGRPHQAVKPGTVVVEPAALPVDPMLLSGVSTIRIGEGATLGASDQHSLRTWETLLAGRQGATGSVPHPSSEQLQDGLAQVAFDAERWWVYLAAMAVYVAVAAWRLARWSQRGGTRAALMLAATALGLVLFHAVSPRLPALYVSIQWSVQDDRIADTDVLWRALFARQARDVALEGLWADLPAVGDHRDGLDIGWMWSQGGWTTHVRLLRGEPRTLWALAPRRSVDELARMDTDAVQRDPVSSWMVDAGGASGEGRVLQHVRRETDEREVIRVLRWSGDI